MDLDIINKLGPIPTFIAILLILNAAYWKSAGKETLAALGITLLGAREYPMSTVLKSMVDKIFGEKHLSWKSFTRSVCASFICVVFFHVLYFSFYKINWQQTFSFDMMHFFLGILFNFMLVNVLFDYLALYKTRVILARMQLKKDVAFSLALDLIYVFGIAILKFFLITLIFNGEKAFSVDSFKFFFEKILTLQYVAFPGSDSENLIKPIPGIFYYSILFYSIFIWLHLLAGVIVSKYYQRFISTLDVKERPVEVLNFTLSAVYFIGWLAVYLIKRVFETS